MASPNIANTSYGFGKSAGLVLGTSAGSILSNLPSSGKVFKVNTLTASNTQSTASWVTVYLVKNAGSTFYIAYQTPIPGNSTLVVISRDSSIYVEENDTLWGLCFTPAGSVHVLCSYEDIS